MYIYPPEFAVEANIRHGSKSFHIYAYVAMDLSCGGGSGSMCHLNFVPNICLFVSGWWNLALASFFWWRSFKIIAVNESFLNSFYNSDFILFCLFMLHLLRFITLIVLKLCLETDYMCCLRQFLYPSEEDLYKLVRFLVERLFELSKDRRTADVKDVNARRRPAFVLVFILYFWAWIF
jgi:hypothetical protein